MNPIGNVVICFALLILSASPATGQSTARIDGIRGAVEMVDRTGAAVGLTARPPAEQDTIRTGADSAVTLVLGADVSILLGERSEVAIRKLGIASVLWFEHGDIQVSSQGPAIEIQSKSGSFSAEEWPFEMEMTGKGTDKEATSIVVTAGAIKARNLDTSSVVFRAAGNNAYRTYSAGGNRQKSTPAPAAPPMFIQPVIGIGGQSKAQTPAAPIAPGSKPPSPKS